MVLTIIQLLPDVIELHLLNNTSRVNKFICVRRFIIVNFLSYSYYWVFPKQFKVTAKHLKVK